MSHQAPNTHWASRDRLLAERIRCRFGNYAAFLTARPAEPEPWADLAAPGRARTELRRVDLDAMAIGSGLQGLATLTQADLAQAVPWTTWA